jgi:hypothetical protein
MTSHHTISSITKYTRYTFIEQKGECIIRYFGRPCDEFAERVWPIKISDGARVTLFNKGLVVFSIVNSRIISHDTQRGGGAR